VIKGFGGGGERQAPAGVQPVLKKKKQSGQLLNNEAKRDGSSFIPGISMV